MNPAKHKQRFEVDSDWASASAFGDKRGLRANQHTPDRRSGSWDTDRELRQSKASVFETGCGCFTRFVLLMME